MGYEDGIVHKLCEAHEEKYVERILKLLNAYGQSWQYSVQRVLKISKIMASFKWRSRIIILDAFTHEPIGDLHLMFLWKNGLSPTVYVY